MDAGSCHLVLLPFGIRHETTNMRRLLCEMASLMGYFGFFFGGKRKIHREAQNPGGLTGKISHFLTCHVNFWSIMFFLIILVG